MSAYQRLRQLLNEPLSSKPTHASGLKFGVSNLTQTGAGHSSYEPSFDVQQVCEGITHTQPALRRSVCSFEFKIKHNMANITDFRAIGPTIDALYEDLIGRMIANYEEEKQVRVGDNDVISVTLEHSDLDKPLFITNSLKKNLKYSDFLDTIFSVVQSNQTFLIDGNLTLKLAIISRLTGSANFSSDINT